MKYAVTAALALALMAGAAPGVASAQRWHDEDGGGHGRHGGQRDGDQGAQEQAPPQQQAAPEQQQQQPAVTDTGRHHWRGGGEGGGDGHPHDNGAAAATTTDPAAAGGARWSRGGDGRWVSRGQTNAVGEVRRRDRDGDGRPNWRDRDVDGDGIPNHRDRDVDGDGRPNARDRDIDGDGRPNWRDRDRDGDGRPNWRDRDRNGDGRPDWRDRNGDGRPDRWQGGSAGPWQGGNWNDGRHRLRDRDRNRPWFSPGRWQHEYRAFRRFHISPYRYPRGFYQHFWVFGEILPFGWYDDGYYLDWAAYGLPPPPIGCEWVQVGADAVLVDVWTGEILSVYRGLFWW